MPAYPFRPACGGCGPRGRRRRRGSRAWSGPAFARDVGHVLEVDVADLAGPRPIPGPRSCWGPSRSGRSRTAASATDGSRPASSSAAWTAWRRTWSCGGASTMKVSLYWLAISPTSRMLTAPALKSSSRELRGRRRGLVDARQPKRREHARSRWLQGVERRGPRRIGLEDARCARVAEPASARCRSAPAWPPPACSVFRNSSSRVAVSSTCRDARLGPALRASADSPRPMTCSGAVQGSWAWRGYGGLGGRRVPTGR